MLAEFLCGGQGDPLARIARGRAAGEEVVAGQGGCAARRWSRSAPFVPPASRGYGPCRQRQGALVRTFLLNRQMHGRGYADSYRFVVRRDRDAMFWVLAVKVGPGVGMWA